MSNVLPFRIKDKPKDSRRVETLAKQKLAMRKAISVCERMMIKCEQKENQNGR